MNKKYLDITNERFGKLLVIRRIENNRFRELSWMCLCECGEYVNVLGKNLKNGTTRSCGCLQKETASSFHKKYNLYDLTSQDYGIGFDSNENEFYFDLEDYEKIKKHCWYINNQGYATSFCNNKNISVHRLVMKAGEKEIIDHSNGKRNDNRKENLRIATTSQNVANSRKYSNNVSGITGVNWEKNSNGWRVRIGIKKSRINIGLYENFEEAVYNRLLAEKKYFGEFAPQRHLFSQYGIEE